jgi:hypothetical protein
VRTYRDWAASLSDEVTSIVRFVTPPPIPDVPEPIRGVPLLTIAAAGRPAENGGALSHLDAGFAMYSVGMPMTPELGEAIHAHLGHLEETMAPGGYFNFTERPCDVDAILPPEVCARLTEVKRRYDPDNMIVANHTVGMAGA